MPSEGYIRIVMDSYAAERKLLGLDQESPALFMTPDALGTLASAIFAAIGRRINDAELVRAVMRDVIGMLPPHPGMPLNPLAVDAGPTTVEPAVDEPADAQQAADDPPEADEPVARNGVEPPRLMRPEKAVDDADSEREHDWSVFDPI